MPDAAGNHQQAAMLARQARSMIHAGEYAIASKADEVDPVWRIIAADQSQIGSNAIGGLPDLGLFQSGKIRMCHLCPIAFVSPEPIEGVTG